MIFKEGSDSVEMIIVKLLAFYELTGNCGFLELVKDILVDDKPCHNNFNCDCLVCYHCMDCKKKIKEMM